MLVFTKHKRNTLTICTISRIYFINNVRERERERVFTYLGYVYNISLYFTKYKQIYKLFKKLINNFYILLKTYIYFFMLILYLKK